MTVHEMLYQVGLLSKTRFEPADDEGKSAIIIRLPDGRKQTIFGKTEHHGPDPVSILYTLVGESDGSTDLRHLLERNASLRYSRIAIFPGDRIVVFAVFDNIKTSVKECAPMLQEIAAVADELEREYFNRDEA